MMDYYERLIASLPEPRTVWADGRDNFPAKPDMIGIYAAVRFEGLYRQAAEALKALVERLKVEDGLREVADPDAPIPFSVPSPHAADPAILPDSALDLPSVRDSECADIGMMPNVTTDATRRDLGRAV